MSGILRKCVGLVVVIFSVSFLVSQPPARAQGRGPGLEGPVSVSIDLNNTIFVLDESMDAVLRVDAFSGERSLLTGRQIGRGEPLSRPVGIATHNRGELFLADRQLDAIVAVDTNTGDRRILLGCPQVTDPCPVTLVGGGLGFIDPIDVDVLDNDTLVVIDSGDGRDAVFLVNINTGDRALVSAPAIGRGPVMNAPMGAAVSSLGDVYVIDERLDAVLRINLGTGDRTVVSGCPEEDDPCPQSLIGRGPAFLSPSHIMSQDRRTLYVTDIQLGAVIRVDTITGNRTVVSDATRGRGPSLFNPAGMALERINSLLMVDASRKSLLRVNTRSGDREVVSKQTDLILSPNGGTYVSSQGFDFAVIIDGLGTLSELSINVDGRDVTDQIQACSRQMALGSGGMVFLCSDVSRILGLQPGRHRVNVRASIITEEQETMTLFRGETWNLLQAQ